MRLTFAAILVVCIACNAPIEAESPPLFFLSPKKQAEVQSRIEKQFNTNTVSFMHVAQSNNLLVVTSEDYFLDSTALKEQTSNMCKSLKQLWPELFECDSIYFIIHAPEHENSSNKVEKIIGHSTLNYMDRPKPASPGK